jgi:hypothetical protein
MDNLEKAIIFDPKWAAQCAIFLLDNPEFIPYKHVIPLTRWQQSNIINSKNMSNKYSPKNINDLMTKILCEKYYTLDLYKNIKDGFVISSDIPPVVKKIYKLPSFKTYNEFYRYFSNDQDIDYFEPELSRLEVFWLFDELDFNSNEDINSFRVYGIFDETKPEPSNPGLRDIWKKESNFINGLSKIYNKKFTTGYEALKFSLKWQRFQYIGFLICLLV